MAFLEGGGAEGNALFYAIHCEKNEAPPEFVRIV